MSKDEQMAILDSINLFNSDILKYSKVMTEKLDSLVHANYIPQSEAIQLKKCILSHFNEMSTDMIKIGCDYRDKMLNRYQKTPN